MKTFKEFMSEALTKQVVKAVARQVYKKQALQQKVAGGKKQTPSPIFSRTRLYHGTDKASSKAIDRDGWKTDKNVTRQMTGSGVYTTPQRSAAQMYANQRSTQRGGQPAVRTFSIPSSVFQRVKSMRQQMGKWNFEKGGQKFNAMQMSPKAANKYDVTNKPLTQTIRPQGSQKTELKQRVNTALQKPQNREALRRQSGIKPRGGSSTLPNVGRGVNQRPSGRNFTPGTGGNFGISGIGLAN